MVALLLALNQVLQGHHYILSKGKIVKNFRFGTFLFFMIENNENQTKNVNFQFLILKEN